jgi:hypothetical protein
MLRKYTLYLAGMLGLILGSVGCGGHHHHDGVATTGYMQTSWKIVDSRTGIEGDCQWAGITEVELAAGDAYSGQPYYFSWPCGYYQGVSDIMPESDYVVAVYGYDAYQKVISSYEFERGVTFPVYPGETTPVSGILYVP